MNCSKREWSDEAVERYKREISYMRNSGFRVFREVPDPHGSTCLDGGSGTELTFWGMEGCVAATVMQQTYVSNGDTVFWRPFLSAAEALEDT